MTSSIPVSRKRLMWLALVVALAIVVAYQTVASTSERSATFVADADIPTVAPGADVLSGVAEVPARIRGYDYRRAAFGDAWDDDSDAPRTAVRLEIAVAIIGGDVNQCDLGDDAVGNPRRRLAVENDFVLADLGG